MRSNSLQAISNASQGGHQPKSYLNQQEDNSDSLQANLLNRIYGAGFNRDTLPSVSRPYQQTKFANESLLNAKIIGSKKSFHSGKKLEPLGYFKQKNVLTTGRKIRQRDKVTQSVQYQQQQQMQEESKNQEQNNQEMEISGAMFHQQPSMKDMRSNSSQVMIQQQILQSQNLDAHPLFKERTKSMYQEMILMQLKQEEHKQNLLQHQITKINSGRQQYQLTNASYLNSMPMPMSTKRGGMSQVLMQQQLQNEEEILNKKYIVNLISGKFDIDPRFKIKVSGRQKHRKLIKPFHTQVESTDIHEEEKAINQTQNPKEEAKSIDNWQQDQNQIVTSYKRPPSKLDKYIDLILKNQRNVDEFVYLVKGNDDDPYDLIVTNYAKTRGDVTGGILAGKQDKNKKPDQSNNNSKFKSQSKEVREYYTISKKGLCHFINSKPVEFILLPYWLKERETYDQIKSLRFFQKFRKWKTLKMWKKNVIRHKINLVKNELRDKLFLLNPHLGKTLLQHKKQLTELSKLKFIDIGSQQLGMTEVPKLIVFKKVQEHKRKFVMDQIQGYSKICRENVREGFKLCLESLRKNQQNLTEDEDFAKHATDNQSALRLKESAYENLGFSDNMSYEQRSELRKECSKFLRFSYLIDFLAMNSLRTIHLNSINDLLQELEKLVKMETVVYLSDEKLRMSFNKEPLLYTKIDLNQSEIPLNEIETEIIPQFLMPPFGTSVIEEFSLIHHLYLRETKELTEEEKRKKAQKKKQQQQQSKAKAKQIEINEDSSDSDNEEAKDKINETKQFEHQMVPNLYKLWLNLNPSLQEVSYALVQCMTDGINSLLAFERWSRHDEMTPYVSVLEEWDDMVGEDWEDPKSNCLNVNDWLKQDEKEEFENTVKSLLRNSYNRANQVMNNFQDYLMMYYDNSQANLSIFKDEQMFQPIESLGYTLELLEYQTNWLMQFPLKIDMGLIRVDCEHLRNVLLPSPENLIKQLDAMIPELIIKRSNEYKNWLAEATSRLKSIIANIDDFVKQTNYLKETEKTLPKIKYRILIVQQQFLKFKASQLTQFEFKKEDENLIQSELNKSALFVYYYQFIQSL